LGYEVLTAASGEEAIRIYSANKEKIDMVILDLIMPGMGGDETFDRLIHADPEIKIIISSGYSVDGKASQLLADGAVGFIQKPFSMNELSDTLQRVFGATQ
jgi:two-component system cell cycle sensor histidine kinase/response regulator CckA